LKKTKEKLEQLQKKVQGGNLAEIPRAIQEFKTLQKNIQAQVDRITSMKSEFEKDLQVAKQQVAELKGGSATITGKLTITDENNLQGNFKAELDNVSLAIPEQKGLANIIAQSLSSIDRINIAIGISGTIDNYQLQIKSNLSEIIAKAVKKAFAGKMKGFESSLMSAIQSKTGESISGANGALSGLLDQNKILNNSDSAYGGLLGQAKGGASSLGKSKGLSLPGGLKLPF
jgi:hypothetical protein